MENFRSPYFSASIREFWSRWHISLSTWFRDYVYIPLGGNRCGKFRHNVNLMITFIVSGLWHGANWTFVLWGAVHGLAQIVENAFLPKGHEPKGSVRALRVFITFLLVMMAWVFFRANSIGEALYVLGNLFTGISDVRAYFVEAGYKVFEASLGDKVSAFMSILTLCVWDWGSLKRDVITRITMKKSPVLRYAFYFGLLTALLCLQAIDTTDFVYFQF